jgi:hypothetical protein
MGASLIIILTGMGLPWGMVLAEYVQEASSSRPQDAENSPIVEGSKVTLQYVATVPGSAGIDYGNISEFIQGHHEISGVGAGSCWNDARRGKKVELSPAEGFGPHEIGKVTYPKTLLPFGTKEGCLAECCRRTRHCG